MRSLESNNKPEKSPKTYQQSISLLQNTMLEKAQDSAFLNELW